MRLTERDRLESDDKFMRHLAQVVRNGLGERAGTCIDPKTQIAQGKTVCSRGCPYKEDPMRHLPAEAVLLAA